jgi:hypothetical protein
MQVKQFPRNLPRSRRQGVALVLVLAFIVLVTGLILAFFSRSLSERQVSNSSASQTRVDLFGQGACDTIIGDLQQEMAAGSTITTLTTVTPNVTLYAPTSATAVPYYVPAPSPSPAVALPNLVKQSAYKQPFYFGSAYSANYPASNRASNASSATASLNGRTVTAKRWNKPLLLPKAAAATSTDYTPVSSFTPPNWVLVARDGSNPTTYTSAMAASSTATTAVIGRYAYNIYDEGGLLDVNAAGYPTSANAYPSEASGLLPLQPTRKSLLSYADLTVPITNTDGSKQPLLTPAELNALVGWRSYASSQPTGSFPSYTPAPTPTTGPPVNLAPFDVSVLASTTGFLGVAATALYSGQSDRAFASRQQLLDFLLQSVASSSSETGSLQNSLQYLGTFSRGLSQPSYMPDPNRPPAQGPPGGTDLGQGNLSTYDNIINPWFLTVRAQSNFARNDGSTAQIGEPLVKKRFALNRLAWLTYEGPSATADATALQPLLNAGYPSTFLSQGTAQNVYNYFGLSWVPDTNNPGTNVWVYHHLATDTVSTSPLTGLPGYTTGVPIQALKSLTTREADFFELLKAGVTVGSIGKAYSFYTTAKGYNAAGNYQCTIDESVDGAIIQMGANIIDQFDYDSFPTRILINTGTETGSGHPFQEYRGIEDLPYLYRVVEGTIMVTDSTPASATLPAVLPATATGIPNNGQGVDLQEPEIWNPHTWNAAAADSAPLRPTSFRVIAVSSDPNGNPNPPETISYKPAWRTSGTNNGNPADYYFTTDTNTTFTPANTELDFTIPNGKLYLFREPTLLAKPGLPLGSGLTIGLGHTINTLAPGTGYIKSLNKASQYPNSTDNQQYIGMVLSGPTYLPMAWFQNLAPGIINYPTSPAAATPGAVPLEFLSLASGDPVTYRMQCEDYKGIWVTYDEKYVPLLANYSYNTWDEPSFGYGRPYTDGTNAIGANTLEAECADPRTSRFGMNYSGRNGLRGSGLMINSPTAGTWAAREGYGGDATASAAQDALWTNRPDENGGMLLGTYTAIINSFGIDSGGGAPGWYPAGSSSSTSPGYSSAWLRPGMLEQNNPAVSAASSLLRFYGDNDATTQTAVGLGCFADPDGVVRRGMSAYVQPSGTTQAQAVPAGAFGAPSGLPLKTAYAQSTTPGGPITAGAEAGSRPIMLNRPFRSVAELGYVFSGTPWRNLDFFTPESGSAALLDVFCLNNTDDPNGLEAGKVNLNTRQAPVLQAILTGAYKDEQVSPAIANALSANTTVTAGAIANGLVTRTSDTNSSDVLAGAGPLRNISELVGKWVSSQLISGTAPFNINGGSSYSGFSGTVATTSTPAAPPVSLSTLLTQDPSSAGYPSTVIQRQREATVRALSAVGQTRVWNLMIDLVAQTGRYPVSGGGTIDKFNVEGEQRYWIHVAIDRYTGQVIDKQVEIVKE